MKEGLKVIARESPTVPGSTYRSFIRNTYTYINAETANEMQVLDLDDDSDDDDSVSDSQLKCPELSSVSRILHAMSSWSTSDTSQLLASLQLQATPKRGDTPQQQVNLSSTSADCSPTTDTGLEHDQESVGSESERQCVSGCSEADGRESDTESIVLPPVHSSAQSQLRMTIFIQQLKRKYDCC